MKTFQALGLGATGCYTFECTETQRKAGIVPFRKKDHAVRVLASMIESRTAANSDCGRSDVSTRTEVGRGH